MPRIGGAVRPCVRLVAPMQLPTTLPLAAAFALLASMACSSPSDQTGGPAAAPLVCKPPGYHEETPAVTIEQVRASLRVPSGEAAAALPVQVCGINLCLPYNANQRGVL